ncbi:hypothetical protein OMAG_000608 [Candidatus Omnitrophus magneticus]|uniref:Uncharacterized protein n=1 Tax=Candidatus Omnitrophus magneticus TaxID=1609969 RepID=A0A0F0CU09_9BACT|nr:hypothetical protein OMAG_000608 [Candidatus Omnitrophus magneticus]
MSYKKRRKKTIDIKGFSLLNLEKIYCFLLDIQEQSQLTDSEDVTLSLLSPNRDKFPLIKDKVMACSVKDWRDDVISYLVGLGIIKCEGVNRPLCYYPGAEHFQGIELTVPSRKEFAQFLKKVGDQHRKASGEDEAHNKFESAGNIKENIALAPTITRAEMKYAKEYSRKDVITFTNKKKGARNYIVLVNGHEVKIQYEKFVVLLYLAIASKTGNNNGWVTKDNYENEQLIGIDTPQMHKIVNKLRDSIKPIEPDCEVSIIENITGDSKYRLSTMPSRIKANVKWLKKKHAQVRAEIQEERKKKGKDEMDNADEGSKSSSYADAKMAYDVMKRKAR